MAALLYRRHLLMKLLNQKTNLCKESVNWSFRKELLKVIVLIKNTADHSLLSLYQTSVFLVCCGEIYLLSEINEKARNNRRSFHNVTQNQESTNTSDASDQLEVLVL